VNVADDEPTPIGTAEELLASVPASDTVDGLLEPDDTVVPVTWSIERRPAFAQWIEADRSVTVNPSCMDRLEVPVTLEVSTEGGEVDVAVDTVLAVGFIIEPDPYILSVNGHGPYAEAVFPDLPGVDPEEFSHKHAFARLDGLGTDSVWGNAGWSTTAGMDEGQAFYAVGFPVNPISNR